jgi:hypothetical protein
MASKKEDGREKMAIRQSEHYKRPGRFRQAQAAQARASSVCLLSVMVRVYLEERNHDNVHPTTAQYPPGQCA